MQDIWSDSDFSPDSFINTLSRYRFERYRKMASFSDKEAIGLYLWNLKLSQSFYGYIHFWEIGLRNKLNDFFNTRYGTNWMFDKKVFIRNLQSHDRMRLEKAVINKQKFSPEFRDGPAESYKILSELSAGFWVSQLSKSYEIPYSWNKNIQKIIPLSDGATRTQLWACCDRILKLRNRVSHQEPIYHLQLPDLYEDLQWILGSMCVSTKKLADSFCNFRRVWASKPV